MKISQDYYYFEAIRTKRQWSNIKEDKVSKYHLITQSRINSCYNIERRLHTKSTASNSGGGIHRLFFMGGHIIKCR